MTVTTDLTEAQKMTIFADVVAAQDAGASVTESRFAVARRHNIDTGFVRKMSGQN